MRPDVEPQVTRSEVFSGFRARVAGAVALAGITMTACSGGQAENPNQSGSNDNLVNCCPTEPLRDVNNDNLIDNADAIETYGIEILNQNPKLVDVGSANPDGKIDYRDLEAVRLRKGLSFINPRSANGSQYYRRTVDVNRDDVIDYIDEGYVEKHRGKEVPNNSFGLKPEEILSYIPRELVIGIKVSVDSQKKDIKEVKKTLEEDEDLVIKDQQLSADELIIILFVDTSKLSNPDNLGKIADDLQTKYPVIDSAEKHFIAGGPI